MEFLKKKILPGCAAILCLALLAGCAVVDPFQREYLADRIMQFDDGDSVELMEEQHIFAGREGSVGGYGIAAGGCGCN
ncbi:MAG: DUF4266 domain-containing protein [Nitrospinae bacterium]|nr:DUF4266 domain-containing protein [Nitrospinota bacterium]